MPPSGNSISTGCGRRIADLDQPRNTRPRQPADAGDFPGREKSPGRNEFSVRLLCGSATTTTEVACNGRIAGHNRGSEDAKQAIQPKTVRLAEEITHMRYGLLSLLLVAILFSHPEVVAAPRNWTDKTGKKSIRAELVRVDTSSIEVVDEKGRIRRIAIDKLSDADKKLAQEHARKSLEAAEIAKEAMTLLLSGNRQEARVKYEEVSRVDSLAIEAPFQLGMLAIEMDLDLETAAKHFERCASKLKQRQSKLDNEEKAVYVACLNNLALIEIRNRKVAKALRNWKQAISIEKNAANEIIHNVGVMTRFSAKKPKADELEIGKAEEKLLGTLSITRLNHQAYPQGTGWLYMKYPTGIPKKPEDAPPQVASTPVEVPPSQPAGMQSRIATGSGVLIAENLVLTNRHVVVRDLPNVPHEAFAIRTWPNFNEPLPAVVEKIDLSNDLAILRLTNGVVFQTPRIIKGQPSLGQKVFAVGLPGGDRFGASPIVTSGSVCRLPVSILDSDDDDVREIKRSIWHDAPINAGSSGGPIISEDGGILGLNYQVLNPEQDLVAKLVFAQVYSLAVSSDNILEFLQQSGISPNLEKDPTATDDELRSAAQKAVVFIEVFDSVNQQNRVAQMEQQATVPAQPPRLQDPSVFEDKSCFICGGKATVRCTERNCKNGLIVGYVVDTTVVNIGGRPVDISKKRKVSHQCGNCRGSGLVPCAFCNRGIDYRFAAPR